MLTVLASICSHTAAARADPPTPPTTAEIRGLVTGGDWPSKRALMAYGEFAFPAYEAILTDPKSTPREIQGALAMLGLIKAERGRFLNLAAGYAGHERPGVRCCVVRLLEQIGSPAEGSILVALLGDEDDGVAYCAARALAVTGGRREVVALDAWLKGGTTRRDDGDFLIHVKMPG
ncbi:MAG: HEAT repeat domain-containing protein [Gemmataceae bacterium]